MPTDLPIAARAPRLAVLIDGENASARIAEALFTEIATLGEASARRIYGDAASPSLKGWIEVLPRWAIHSGGLWLVCAGGKHLPRKVTAFREFVIEAFRAAPLATA